MSESNHPSQYSETDLFVSLQNLTSPILDDDLIIFPTTRLSQKYKAELIRRNIFHNPDRITTLTDFCKKYHDDQGHYTRIISDGQALLVLTDTLDQIRDEIPIFFNQRSPSPGTIRDLFTLRTIISQRSIDYVSHPLFGSSEKCRQISRALTAYLETLTQNHLLDSSGLIEWIVQDFSSREGHIFSRVVIHRLFEIFPREKKLIQVIRSHATTFRFEFPAGKDPGIFSLPDWLNPEELVQIESTPGLERYSDLFIRTPSHTPPALLQMRVFASPTEELESIAEEIHALAAEGIPLEEIGITFPDISPVLPSLQEVLNDFGIPAHSFSGEPLLREPLIGFLLLFPSLVIDAFPRETVISLISSPYFAINQSDLPDISVGEFDWIVRAAGIEGGYSWDRQLLALKTPPDETAQYLPPIHEESIDAVRAWFSEITNDFNQFRDTLTPAEYTAVFHRLCRRWMRPEFRVLKGKSEDQILVHEIQAYNHFLGCLTRLSHLLDSTDMIPLSRFRRFLIHLLEEPVNLTPDSGGVRIMGLRQTVGMDFSCLFIGGLIEDEIPNPSTRIPLLTSPESEKIGTRGLNEVIKGEQYYFISGLSSGKRVWLSASKSSGERKVLTSSFLEQVRKVCNPSEWGQNITHSRRRAAFRAGKGIGRGGVAENNCPADSLTWLSSDQTYGSIATRILIEDWYRTGKPDTVYDGILTEDDEVIAWLADSRMFGPERIWSPTQLETYANCPFRFFLDRVIRVNPLPEVDPTLSPALKGSLIHGTLYKFFIQWCRDGPRNITSHDLSEASSLLTEIGSEMSGKFQYHSPVWHATIQSLLGSGDVPGIYDRFLLHESKRETLLRPALFELPIGNGEDTKPGYVILQSDVGEPVRIQGRIDRIDITEDGQFAIIDYKTGSKYPNSERIREGKALQLPLYLLALEKMHNTPEKPMIGIGGSYLELNRNITQTWPLIDPEKKNIAGISTRKKATADFPGVIKGALVAAQRYITDIRNGIFPVSRDTCTISGYCPYSGICRFDRFRIIEPDMGGIE